MSTTFTREQVAAWQAGADGFLQWVRDIRPQVPGPRGPAITFTPETFQVEAVRRLLRRKRNGDFFYTTLGLTWPRRHSKTTIAALLCLWRLTTKVNENIICLSNSERQAASVGFGLCRKIVSATPALLAQVGADNVQAYRLSVPALGSQMRTVSGNLAGLYGEKVTAAWVSEIHAAASDEAMQVLASSLGDSVNSWLLLDSTTDGIGGPLHRLEQLQETGEDKTVYIHRIEYRDLDEALQKSPSWIRRDWLRSRQKQLLPQVFASQHLNLRQESTSSLFRKTDIEACRDRLPHPMTLTDLEAVAQGRTYVVGAGLDRAYGFSLHGDSTILTYAAKVAAPDPLEEPHFYVLRQDSIFGSLGKLIKKSIQSAHDEFSLTNCIVEAYNAQDVFNWCQERGIASEVVHATGAAQQAPFLELHRIVKEHRLHFSPDLEDLAREMETFIYEMRGGTVKFGSDRFHDDRVYSLAWAIHSLRQQELASYSLDSIVCGSRSTHAPACYLRGGDLVLPCSAQCRSAILVQQMWNQYRSGNVDSELQLHEFFTNLVSVDGVSAFL